ncbi:nicotinate-nucleotide--dimethylbenzimidazole phosphoribosyltransferase [Streptomyces sp. NPDC048483]|uniref:nicotinate-nucleotide--dimethylbenzimidazole phosphoribosyltransferase n=1 Tax=Streptomyces sp. NPDC048483 TaxID=3154927 RepID=UPI003417C2F2
MTDTGQVPGEGQPENAGGHPGQPQPAAVPSPADAGPTQQQGIAPQPDAYSYLEGADAAVEDDDLLLMPGAQGAWSEQQAQPMPQQQAAPGQSAPMPVPAGDHESGGRDSGAVDVSAVRIPQPAAPQQEQAPAAAQPARRPLHMGPPVPDPPTGGVVRSLADRGPADTPSQTVGRHAGPPATGPEHPDAQPATPVAEQPLVEAAQAAQSVAMPPYGEQPYDGQLYAEQSYGAAGQGPLPGPQLGEIPSQMPPWNEASAQAAAAPVAAPAEPVASAQEAPLPVEQPPAQPLPMPVAEQEAPEPVAVVADAAVALDTPADAAADADAVQVTAQDVAADESAAADGPVADAATAEAPGPEVGTTEAAPEAFEPVQQTPQAEAPAEEPQEAVAPAEQVEAVQAAEPAEAVEVTADAVAAVEAVEAVQETPAEAPVEAPAEVPVEAQPVAAPEAEAVSEAVTEADAAPEADVPVADVPEAPAAPEADAPEADQAPQAEARPEPVEQPQPAEAAEPGPEAAPVADAAPMPVDAPQGPIALPAPASATPPEEPLIEQPEEQLPAAGLPQPAEAEEPPAGEQAAPQGQETPAEPAADTPAAQPAPPAADDLGMANDPGAEGTDTAAAAQATEPAEPVADTGPEPVELQPAAVHIPAQAAVEPAPDTQPAAAEPSEGRPHQQDAAELVQLGEGQEDDQPQVAADEAEAAPEAPEADADPAPQGAPAAGYDDSERAAVHRVMRERRDIRNGFRSDPIPNDVLLRVLEAAHTAPSVGHSQPWDFVVIRSDETRERMHQLATAQRDAYAKSLPKARAKQFRELKIEAILETPVNIVVTADPTRGGRHTLGRHTQPQMAPYSSALAVENLWLAARAEGLGVGWVSFFDEREMVRELGLPEHLEVVAYLCVGFVDEFPDEPELLQAGWSKRRPLSWVVHEETYGRRALPGEDPHDLLQETLQGIRPLDAKALGEAWERQKRMTKPAGALGMLEIISAQLCGLSRKCPPPIPEPAAVAVFAGDHGVHAQGVTPWPQEVTGQMVANFLGGGAVCNAFANQVGAEVCVVDVGVAGELPATPGLLPRKVRPGTADFTAGPAMTQEDVFKAIEVGIETARDLVAAGNKALLTGEMGIANTTTSAALISVYTGADPVEVTGRGTGINDETHARKVDVVRRALELHQPDPADPIGVLTAVGGLEHAALVGLILGGASLRTPVILDGVSAGAAALVARAIAPEALAACIAGHRSAEPGHVAALTKLGLRPLVDLDLRLGEGTGALLALPLVQSAARAMHEVATFDSAGVTEKS